MYGQTALLVVVVDTYGYRFVVVDIYGYGVVVVYGSPVHQCYCKTRELSRIFTNMLPKNFANVPTRIFTNIITRGFDRDVTRDDGYTRLQKETTHHCIPGMPHNRSTRISVARYNPVSQHTNRRICASSSYRRAL